MGRSQAKWQPNGIAPLRAPLTERLVHDHRWRPHRPTEAAETDRTARALKAIADQRLYKRMHGYTGFAPRVEPKDRAVAIATPPAAAAATLPAATAASAAAPSACEADGGIFSATMSPAAACAAVATAAEGVGGVLRNAGALNAAGRVAAGTPRAHPAAVEEYALYSRVAEASRRAGGEAPAESHLKVAASIREHCTRAIPGYMGHMPRVKGESMFGVTVMAANRLAADLVDDKVFNPDIHHETCMNPQRYNRGIVSGVTARQ